MRWPLLERRHMKTKKLLRYSLFFLLLFAGESTVLAQDTVEEINAWEQDCAEESTVNPGTEGFVTSLPLDPSYAEECKNTIMKLPSGALIRLDSVRPRASL